MSEVRLLVSRKQAIALKKRGFNLKCSHYLVETLESPPIKGRRFNSLCNSTPVDWNHVEVQITPLSNKEKPYISVPTVFEALYWLNNLSISSLRSSVDRALKQK